MCSRPGSKWHEMLFPLSGAQVRRRLSSRSRLRWEQSCHLIWEAQMLAKDAMWSLWSHSPLWFFRKAIPAARKNHVSFEKPLLVWYWALVDVTPEHRTPDEYASGTARHERRATVPTRSQSQVGQQQLSRNGKHWDWGHKQAAWASRLPLSSMTTSAPAPPTLHSNRATQEHVLKPHGRGTKPRLHL